MMSVRDSLELIKPRKEGLSLFQAHGNQIGYTRASFFGMICTLHVYLQ